MPSKIVVATIQAIVLGASSNIIAQSFAAYSGDESFSLDVIDILRFAALSIITTPPNFIWQGYLEKKFPSKEKVPAKAGGGKGGTQSQLSVKNTIAKFFLDQSIGCWINSLAFLLLVGVSKGVGVATLIGQIRNEFWSMVFSSYKFWPMVTLTNLILIPVGQRILVGNIAGFLWGVYLSLITAG